MGGKPRALEQGEMQSFRLSPELRIELHKLANKRRKPVSVLLRDLITQAAAAQRAQKSAPAGAAQSTTSNQA